MASTPSGPSNGGRPTDRTPSRTPARAVHTPLDRSAPRELLNSLRRGTPGSARRPNNAPTPHAKAARRALNDRRTAMFTPGKKRRRSLMGQREDAMQLLKSLSTVLAPKSQPIVSSSSSSASADSPATGRRRSVRSKGAAAPEDDYDDLDDDFPIERPRLSLNLDAEDNEDDLEPPELSKIDGDDDYTLEFPRRMLANQANSRLSRGSLGSLHGSDYPNHDPTGEVDMPSDFFGGALGDLQVGQEDVTFDRIDPDQTIRPIERESFGFEMPFIPEIGTSPFQLDITERSVRSPSQTQSLAGATAQTATNAAGSDMGGPSSVDGFGSDRGEVEDFPSSDEGDLPVADEGIDDRGAELDDRTADLGARDAALDDEDVDLYGVSDAEDRPDELDGVNNTIGDVTAATTAVASSPEPVGRITKPLKKRKKISRHGIEYPPLPTTFVKRVAQNALQNAGLSNTRISTDTLAALTQASDWFFEQLGDDLEAYANHAKRKTIEESDVVTLMRRQRQVGSNATVFSLAQKHLPRELLQELRMPPPQPAKRRQAKRARVEDGQGEETT